MASASPRWTKQSGWEGGSRGRYAAGADGVMMCRCAGNGKGWSGLRLMGEGKEQGLKKKERENRTGAVPQSTKWFEFTTFQNLRWFPRSLVVAGSAASSHLIKSRIAGNARQGPIM